MTETKLHKLVNYDCGSLIRKKPRGHKRLNYKLGHLNSKGYLKCQLDGKEYLVHRLVWLYHYGELPPIIDHINGVKDDNRIENLRAVDSTTNATNRLTDKGGKIGTRLTPSGTYIAYTKVKGVYKHIGSYPTEQQAITARRDYVTKLGYTDRMYKEI